MSKKKKIKALKKERAALRAELASYKQGAESLTRLLAQASAEAVDVHIENKVLREVTDDMDSVISAFEIDEVITDKETGTTTVRWSDGSETSAVCTKEDTFCGKTGVMICLSKRLIEEMYSMSVPEFMANAFISESDKKLMSAYLNLKHPNKQRRIKALKRWTKVDAKKRQSIRDRVANLQAIDARICNEGCIHSEE